MENNKKFRYTKQLIAMALRDNWTQKQIAEACRTQQSVVSSWKSGAAQAKESQLTKLLEIYGPRLRRKTFKIYHDLILPPEGQWRLHLLKVEGDVLLSFPFRNKTFCTRCQTESPSCNCSVREKRIVATRRIVVHALGSGTFCVLSQQRMLKEKYQMQLPETNVFSTRVIGTMDNAGMLAFVDSGEWAKDEEDNTLRVTQQILLQLLIRKSLLEHGYSVENVEEYRAS